MHDLQLGFGHDRQVVLEQQIVVAMDAAADRVLDGQQAMRRPSLTDRSEHVLELLARDGLDPRPRALRSHLAVRAGCPLKRDSHGSSPFASLQFPVSSSQPSSGLETGDWELVPTPSSQYF